MWHKAHNPCCDSLTSTRSYLPATSTINSTASVFTIDSIRHSIVQCRCLSRDNSMMTLWAKLYDQLAIDLAWISTPTPTHTHWRSIWRRWSSTPWWDIYMLIYRVNRLATKQSRWCIWYAYSLAQMFDQVCVCVCVWILPKSHQTEWSHQ